MTTATRTIRIVIDSTNANRQVNTITQNTNAATFATNKLAAAIGGVISAYASVNAVKSIAAIGDEYAKITGLLRNATSSQDEFNFALEESKRVAEATRASLSTTVETFAALNRVTEGSGRSQKELFGILETVNKSIALTSPNAESAAAALTQFGQALGGDFKAGAQELNSILEQTPGLAQAVASGLGVATKDLKKMGEEGELSAAKVLDALKKVADDVDERFAKIPATVSGTLTLIKNDLLATFGEEKVAEPIIGSLVELRETLNDPAVKEGLVTLASALVKVTTWAASAASKFADFGKELGFFAASISGQVSELDGLQKMIERIDQSVGKSRWFARDSSFWGKDDAMLLEIRAANEARIQEINDGIVGITAAERKLITEREKLKPKMLEGVSAPSMPTLGETKTPELSTPKLKLVFEGDKEAYRAAEEAARQHKKNMASIQAEHDDAMAPENKMWDQLKEVQDVNKSMKLELASRLSVAQFYRDAEAAGTEGSYAREKALINAMAEEKRAAASQRASEDLQKIKDQEAEALVQVGANEQARDLIIKEYATQREIAAEIHAANIAAINKKAADDQKRLDEAAAKAKYDTFIGMGQDLMNAAQGQSKKLFHASREAAVASAIIDSGKSALAAWRKGMESGGPWTAAGFAAASLLKTVPMVQKLKNSSYSGGGGSMSMGSGSAAISQMPTTATSNEPAFEQKKVIELRGITPETLLSGQQFIDALTSTGAVVAMNNAQAQAQRIGVI